MDKSTMWILCAMMASAASHFSPLPISTVWSGIVLVFLSLFVVYSYIEWQDKKNKISFNEDILMTSDFAFFSQSKAWLYFYSADSAETIVGAWYWNRRVEIQRQRRLELLWGK